MTPPLRRALTVAALCALPLRTRAFAFGERVRDGERKLLVDEGGRPAPCTV